jgi:thioredoxin reductase (NADPH)
LSIYDVIIVGGGPAGLTAGLYTTRARLKTLLIESYTVPSQATVTALIENYPGFPEKISGFELIDKFKKQARNFGLEFSVGNVKNIQKDKDKWQIVVEDKIYNCLSLIIAVGARPKKLGVAGEDKFRSKGVSYCATCDGALFKDKEIVVVGGGNTAIEEALFLTRFGKKVTLIHRRDKLRATKILQERALSNKKIDFVWSSQVIEILGDESVEAVKVKNIKTCQLSKILCNGVFIFVGLVPNTDFLKGIIELDEEGYIITDDNMKTSQEGIFACGDCRKKLLRQVVTACGDGAIAAFSAQKYVEGLKAIEYK